MVIPERHTGMLATVQVGDNVVPVNLDVKGWPPNRWRFDMPGGGTLTVEDKVVKTRAPRAVRRKIPAGMDAVEWSLVSAIIADPGDMTSRLALADWYDEQRRGPRLPLDEDVASWLRLMHCGWWSCVWSCGKYRVRWLCRTKGQDETAEVAALSRSECPRCWSCGGTQPIAWRDHRWKWLCCYCRDFLSNRWTRMPEGPMKRLTVDEQWAMLEDRRNQRLAGTA